MAGNTLLIPVKGILLYTFSGSFALIIQIYIDKTITFLHFTSSSRNNRPNPLNRMSFWQLNEKME